MTLNPLATLRSFFKKASSARPIPAETGRQRLDQENAVAGWIKFLDRTWFTDVRSGHTQGGWL